MAAAHFKNRFHSFEAFVTESGEFATPMIDSWAIHGPEDAIGNVCWAWNLQEMSTRLAAQERTIHSVGIANSESSEASKGGIRCPKPTERIMV
jgi:hypothetical protein